MTDRNFIRNPVIAYEQIKERLEQKIAECEELKKQCRDLENQNVILQNRNQQLDGSITKAKIYEQTLDEIKECYKKYPKNSKGFKHHILEIVSEAYSNRDH